jgi:hypothetical protein
MIKGNASEKNVRVTLLCTNKQRGRHNAKTQWTAAAMIGRGKTNICSMVAFCLAGAPQSMLHGAAVSHLTKKKS